MTIKTDHGSFEVRELTFADRRKLHRLEVQAVDLKTGEMDTNQFYNVLEWVMEHAFEDVEKALAHLDDNKIDEVLIAIYNSYKQGVAKKKN